MAFLKVTTVDKYQGLQNDYILLSLVRTKTVGHLRDIRRLVVAMSRAKLGLYIFGRAYLFNKCIELSPSFSMLMRRPLELCIYPQEKFSSQFDANRGEYQTMKDMPTMVKLAYQMLEEHKKMEIDNQVDHQIDDVNE